MSKSWETGQNVESQRGKGILDRGNSMDKGLEATLNEPSNFSTETLSSMSYSPGLCVSLQIPSAPLTQHFS